MKMMFFWLFVLKLNKTEAINKQCGCDIVNTNKLIGHLQFLPSIKISRPVSREFCSVFVALEMSIASFVYNVNEDCVCYTVSFGKRFSYQNNNVMLNIDHAVAVCERTSNVREIYCMHIFRTSNWIIVGFRKKEESFYCLATK